jgi:serine/threonine protein kinase
LFYPNAGIDLFDFNVPPETFVPFFEGLRNIVRGLALFHMNDLVHMDIKPENIVAKWNPTTRKYLIRYIDFGFAFSTRIMEFPEFARFWERNYSIWPYELRFMNPRFEEDMITDDSVRAFFSQSLVHAHYAYPIHIFHKCDASFYKAIWKRCALMTYPQRVDFIAKTTDVYSLGRAMSLIYYKFSKHICGKKEAEIVLPESGSEALRTQVSTPFYFEFVAALMEPDPFRRPEIYEVDAMYNEILLKIGLFMRGGGRRTRRRKPKRQTRRLKD